MFKIYDGREHFYQWDADRKLIIEDASIVEVHFCNRTDDCSLVCETYVEDGLTLVNVPNILLQNDWCIRVYAYDGKHTKHEERYDVIARTKPADYAYEETEVLTWHTISEKVDEALGNTGYYVPSVDSDGNLTWEGSTEILPEVAAVNIKGAKGDKGDTGATGAQGLRGERGEKGEKGERGETGPEGKPGKDGSIKFEELTAAQKAELKGDKGEQGERGLTGATGAKGADGISATHEWNGTTLIITSASGTTAQDLKGAKGDKGEKGDPGIKGDTGAIGAQGIQGEKGEQGAQGIQGEKGEKGDKGDTGKDGYSPVRGVDYWTPTDKAEIIAEASSGAIDLSGYVTDDELTNTLRNYPTFGYTAQYDTQIANNAIAIKTKANAEDVYTKSEVDAKLADVEVDVDLTGYVTENYVADNYVPLTGGVLNGNLDAKKYYIDGVSFSAVDKVNSALSIGSSTYSARVASKNKPQWFKDGKAQGTFAITSDIPSLEGYATKTYVNDAISSIPTGGGAADRYDISGTDAEMLVGFKKIYQDWEANGAPNLSNVYINNNAIVRGEKGGTVMHLTTCVDKNYGEYATYRYPVNNSGVYDYEAFDKTVISGGGTVDLSNYYTKNETAYLLAGYATMSQVEAKGYQTASQVQTAINSALGVIENGTY